MLDEDSKEGEGGNSEDAYRFGHIPKQVLTQILRASKASAELIQPARYLKCTHCDANKSTPKTSKVSLPQPYEFNHTVGVDVLSVHDIDGTKTIDEVHEQIIDVLHLS